MDDFFIFVQNLKFSTLGYILLGGAVLIVSTYVGNIFVSLFMKWLSVLLSLFSIYNENRS